MDYTLPKLYNTGGKILSGKPWYVHFSQTNENGIMQLIKKKTGINYFKTVKERTQQANLLITEITNLLLSGYNFHTSQTIEGNGFENMTTLELMQKLYETKEGTLRKKSKADYRYTIGVFKDFLQFRNQEIIYPEHVTRQIALAYSDYLLLEKKYGARNHNNQISNMRTFFFMMVDREVIERNPFVKIPKRPVEKGKHVAFSKKQKEEIKKYLFENEHPLYLFVQFIYYCGIRRSELMETQVKHIDFKDRRLQITSSNSKNREQSSTQLPPHFFKLVKEKYEKLDPELFLFSKDLLPGAHPKNPNLPTKEHRKVLNELNISIEHTLYSWKHTGAIAAIQSGMSPYSLMIQFRHSSLKETMIYLKHLGQIKNDDFTKHHPEF